MNMRLSSKRWRDDIDSFKTEYAEVSFLLGFGQITNEIEVLIKSGMNDNNNLKMVFYLTKDGYGMKMNKGQWKREKKGADHLQGAVTFFTSIVSSKFFQANRLSIKLDDRCYNANGVSRKFMDIVDELLSGLDHKIQVKEFFGYGLSYESARFLKYLMPGILETIQIDTLSEVDPPQNITDTITKLEQWKNAKVSKINGKKVSQSTSTLEEYRNTGNQHLL